MPVLWNLQTGRVEYRFQPASLPADAGAFSADSAHLALADQDRIAIYDATSGQPVRQVAEVKVTYKAYAIAFSPDGKELLAGMYDGTTVFFDGTTGQRLRSFQTHRKKVNILDTMISLLAFHPDGKTVLSADLSGPAVRWNRNTGEVVATFSGRQLWIGAVAFSSDGRYLATAAGADRLLIWEPAAATPPRRVAISGTGYQLHPRPTGSEIGVIAVVPPPAQPPGSFVPAPLLQSLEVVDAAKAERTRGWGVPLPPIPIPVNSLRRGNVTYAQASADGRRLLAWRGGDLAVWDALSAKPLSTLTIDTSWRFSWTISPNGKWLLDPVMKLGDQFQTLDLWDVDAGVVRHQLRGQHIIPLVFTPDGREALTLDQGKTIARWDTATGAKIREFTWDGPGIQVPYVAISPDGGRLFLELADNSLAVVERLTGRLLQTLRGHSSLLSKLAVSPDGRHLVVTAADGTARLWDLATGEELACLIVLKSGDWLAVTPDGLFDGSIAGREQVSYRLGGGLNVLPVDRFFNAFYRPGLLGLLWRGEAPRPDGDFTKLSPPTIRIVKPPSAVVDAKQIELQVEVTDEGGGVQGPVLFQNGSLIRLPGLSQRDGNVVRRTFVVPLAPGDNDLEVRASTASGSPDSEAARLTVRYDKRQDKPNLYILAVGVNQYARTPLNLKFAANDAHAVLGLFRERGRRFTSAWCRTN